MVIGLMGIVNFGNIEKVFHTFVASQFFNSIEFDFDTFLQI